MCVNKILTLKKRYYFIYATKYGSFAYSKGLSLQAVNEKDFKLNHNKNKIYFKKNFHPKNNLEGLSNTELSQRYKEKYPFIVRIGFTVSKKTGNSVTRNKVKRRFRHLVKEVIIGNSNKNYYYVLIGNHNSAKISFNNLKSDLIYCLKTLKLFVSTINNQIIKKRLY